jgi:probable HAF family extracellular repeat protein
MSSDGSVIVGSSTNHAFDRRAFRWTTPGGMQELGTLGGTSSESIAYATSSDGSVVVGTSLKGGLWKVFLWTAEDGMQDIGVEGAAYAVSADGDVLAGEAVGPGNNRMPFRWSSSTGVEYITSGIGQARGISADGSVVVGYTNTPTGSIAFRWTPVNGATELPPMNGNTSSIAYAVSGDGQWAVGSCFGTFGEQAVRWTSLGVGESLGVPLDSSNWSRALATSADGSTVVGRGPGRVGVVAHAFRWTEAFGVSYLGNGSGTLGSTTQGNSVSADGLVVAGESSGGVAFRWTGHPTLADYNGDLYLEVVDFLDFFDDFGTCFVQPAPCGQFGDPDVNGDTSIDVLDFLDFLDAFGQGC